MQQDTLTPTSDSALSPPRRHGPSGEEESLCSEGPGPDGPAGTPVVASDRAEADHRNEILVAGRITARPHIRELPSGDRLATWRICVVRPDDSRYGGRPVDSITCTSFDPLLHERIRLWKPGDVVRMTGELRRRTWRGREGVVRSVCEVEARTATLVRAAGGDGRERR